MLLPLSEKRYNTAVDQLPLPLYSLHGKSRGLDLGIGCMHQL